MSFKCPFYLAERGDILKLHWHINQWVTFYFLDYALARDLGFGISMMIFLWATCIITIQDIGRAYPVLT
ncbi:hypothetical protein C3387_23280 [Leclercia sp. LSNIH6]|nr:hypothetical protein C3387_23280 [Leclercia sp. LSNIH6]